MFKNFLSTLFIKNNNSPDNGLQGRVYPPGSLLFGGSAFDGEQEPGALNDVYVYDVDYYTLAKRAYTLVTINEFARIAVSRLTQFAIGTGLKLHPEPLKSFLKKKFKIILPEEFTKDIQDLWSLLEDDELISITKEDNIHSLAKLVFFNSFVAGDILVIKRVVNKNLQYQLVNGLSVQSSLTKAENGNEIKNGVEIDSSGVHVAYYVVDDEGKETRIDARDKKGRLIAWLVYASDKRLNDVRGYSPLGAIMQKLHKIGQYSNSEVIAADANSKLALVIEQSKDSSGVNPIKGPAFTTRGIQDMLNRSGPAVNNNHEVKNLMNRIKKWASAIAFHLPIGQKMSSFDTKRPNVNYTAFLDGSNKYNYASLGIPFEIAVLLFSNNFSASRAALKMFELILKHVRKFTIIDRFYQIIYKQFFELECLKGNIYAPKFLQLQNDNGYLDNAYTKAKFFGIAIPHIDEVKEVNAVLSKLKGGLTTFEQALETLGNTSDFDSLIERRKIEEEKIKAAGLKFETLFAPESKYSKGNEDENE